MSFYRLEPFSNFGSNLFLFFTYKIDSDVVDGIYSEEEIESLLYNQDIMISAYARHIEHINFYDDSQFLITARDGKDVVTQSYLQYDEIANVWEHRETSAIVFKIFKMSERDLDSARIYMKVPLLQSTIKSFFVKHREAEFLTELTGRHSSIYLTGTQKKQQQAMIQSLTFDEIAFNPEFAFISDSKSGNLQYLTYLPNQERVFMIVPITHQPLIRDYSSNSSFSFENFVNLGNASQGFFMREEIFKQFPELMFKPTSINVNLTLMLADHFQDKTHNYVVDERLWVKDIIQLYGLYKENEGQHLCVIPISQYIKRTGQRDYHHRCMFILQFNKKSGLFYNPHGSDPFGTGYDVDSRSLLRGLLDQCDMTLDDEDVSCSRGIQYAEHDCAEFVNQHYTHIKPRLFGLCVTFSFLFLQHFLELNKRGEYSMELVEEMLLQEGCKVYKKVEKLLRDIWNSFRENNPNRANELFSYVFGDDEHADYELNNAREQVLYLPDMAYKNARKLTY